MSHLLVTFANVKLYGSCAIGVLDTQSYHFSWLEKTGYVDISGIIRAIHHDNLIILLYKNSNASKRLLILDQDFSVIYSHADNLTSNISDIFSDGTEIYAMGDNGIYLLHIQDHVCSLTLVRLIDVPPGGRPIRFSYCGNQLTCAIAQQEHHENRKFAIVVRVVSDVDLPPRIAEYQNVSEVTIIDGAMFIADSSTCSLSRMDESGLTEVVFPRGYVRGIAKVPGGYFVGTGSWRYPVRKFGKRLHPAWVSRADHHASYSSQIHRLDDDLQVRETLDISHLGLEISSLLPIPSWPVPITSLDTHRAASRRANYANELVRTSILAEIEAGK